MAKTQWINAGVPVRPARSQRPSSFWGMVIAKDNAPLRYATIALHPNASHRLNVSPIELHLQLQPRTSSDLWEDSHDALSRPKRWCCRFEGIPLQALWDLLMAREPGPGAFGLVIEPDLGSGFLRSLTTGMVGAFLAAISSTVTLVQHFPWSSTVLQASG